MEEETLLNDIIDEYAHAFEQNCSDIEKKVDFYTHKSIADRQDIIRDLQQKCINKQYNVMEKKIWKYIMKLSRVYKTVLVRWLVQQKVQISARLAKLV